MAAAVVIAAYRPKPGGADRLPALVRDHLPTPRRLGLVRDRCFHGTCHLGQVGPIRRMRGKPPFA